MMNLSPNKSVKIVDLILIIVFIVILYLPLADTFFHLDPTPPLIENRKLNSWPDFKPNLSSLLDYPKDFEAFFNDNIGFRSALIQGRSMLMVQMLGVSSNPAVILGKNDWLYLRSEHNFDYYRSKRLFTPKELAAWQNRVEENHDILAKYGIRYLIVVAPNKDTIYPEFMPDELPRLQQESRLDQLLNYLHERHTNVDILDLRDSLKQAKTQYPVYNRADTHWNDRGAFVAYQEIIKRMSNWFPQLHVLPPSQFEIVTKNRGNFDLFILLGLGNILQDEWVQMVPLTPLPAYEADPRIPYNPAELPKPPIAMEVKDDSLPTAVVFHDSFMDRLRPFLSQNFKRIVFFPSSYYNNNLESQAQILEREHPDVVIHEFVERNLQIGVNILPIKGD